MTFVTRKDLVKQKVQEIREHYKTGKRILKEVTAKAKYGEGQFDKLKEEYDTNADTLRKARQFAKEYTEEQFKELCSSILRIQSIQAPELGIFGVSHVTSLLRAKGDLRKSIQDKAIQGGWNLEDLKSAIKTHVGTRRNGGRDPKIPSTILGVFEMIGRHCESWRRWNLTLKKKWETLEDDCKTKPGVPPQLKVLIDATGKKVNKLFMEIETQISKEIPGWGRRQDVMKQTKAE